MLAARGAATDAARAEGIRQRHEAKAAAERAAEERRAATDKQRGAVIRERLEVRDVSSSGVFPRARALSAGKARIARSADRSVGTAGLG